MGKYSYKKYKMGRKQSFKKRSRKSGGDNKTNKSDETSKTKNDKTSTEPPSTPVTENKPDETSKTKNDVNDKNNDEYSSFINDLINATTGDDVQKTLNKHTFIMENIKKVTLHNKKGNWKTIDIG